MFFEILNEPKRDVEGEAADGRGRTFMLWMNQILGKVCKYLLLGKYVLLGKHQQRGKHRYEAYATSTTIR